MQRRLTVAPFDRRFKKSADPTLFAKIWADELSGILNKYLNGLRRISKRGGFKEPVDVRKATAKLLREANPLPGFLQERCKRASNETCWMKDLYKAYCAWCDEMGISKTQQQPTVRRNLVQLGYKVKHGNQGDKVYGLKLSAAQFSASDESDGFSE
jgi:putative DNA primase/helicase